MQDHLIPGRDDPECTGATSPYAEAPEPVLYNWSRRGEKPTDYNGK